MNLAELVRDHFSLQTNCYRHCDEPTTLRIIAEGEATIGCYTCPSGYVSRVVLYAKRAEPKLLMKFLKNSAGEMDIAEADMRIASRHPWDLGIDVRDETVFQEVYWTQNYRRTESNQPQRKALFVCANCNSLYLKPLNSEKNLCDKCSAG